MMHKWTYNEDLICCQECVKYGIILKDKINSSILIHNLSLRLPKIKEGSIRMKIQNIKQLMIEYKLVNTLMVKPLSSYSRLCNIAFDHTLDIANIKY